MRLFPPEPRASETAPPALPEAVASCTTKSWALLKIVHQLLTAALLPITLRDFGRLGSQIAATLRSNHSPSRPAALDACLGFLRDVLT